MTGFATYDDVARNPRRLVDPADPSVETVVRAAGRGVTEELPVEQLGDGLARLLATPCFVEGVAAADVVRLDDAGGFALDARGGNAAVLFELEGALADVPQRLATLFDPIGGWVDGWAEGASGALVVCTVPVRAGFPAIEDAAGRALVETGAIRWTYGNR
jgi:hypothetical protein